VPHAGLHVDAQPRSAPHRAARAGRHARDREPDHLCEGHHLAHHAGAIVIEGTASTAKFTRRAESSFALAERAADTAAALRGLGFSRHEVAAAMDKTRAHVGTAELTLQQWITIALGYCPKPRA
jgi:hypothetical protein